LKERNQVNIKPENLLNGQRDNSLFPFLGKLIFMFLSLNLDFWKIYKIFYSFHCRNFVFILLFILKRMPTINQLVKRKRKTPAVKSKSPALQVIKNSIRSKTTVMPK
jgi:hypothetical protein